MRYFAGLDVSQLTTSICVVASDGTVVREGKVKTDASAICLYLNEMAVRFVRVGLEASSISGWLYDALSKNGVPVVCIESRHAHSVLKSRPNKTDRGDARGLAEIMRMGVFRQVHIKTQESQAIRSLLSARRLLLAKIKDIENGIRSILGIEGSGLKSRGRVFDGAARKILDDRPDISEYVFPLLQSRIFLIERYRELDGRVKELCRTDPVCSRLVTVPGVGPLVALAFRSTIDVPERFARSRLVGAHLGLTPRIKQSGMLEVRGRITRCGDRYCRSLLCKAAMVLLTRCAPFGLQSWGLSVVERRGWMKGVIAVGRRLATLLHRMWIDGTVFDANRWRSGASELRA